MDETITQFIRFLKENKIYYSYVMNAEKHNSERIIKYTLIKLLKTTIPHNFISNAFMFANTEKTYNFWLNMSLKWRKTLKD